jgi:hypothetical protein
VRALSRFASAKDGLSVHADLSTPPLARSPRRFPVRVTIAIFFDKTNTKSSAGAFDLLALLSFHLVVVDVKVPRGAFALMSESAQFIDY